MLDDIVNFEYVRNQYKPESVRVLFVGESRPSNGTFFYLGDSNLARHTQVGFEQTFNIQFGTPLEFLRWFKENGYFLDDLCPEPVNQLPRDDRRETCRENVPALALRIKEYQPEFIASTPMSITPFVIEAIQKSGVNPRQQWHLPFPACGHQRQYENQLSNCLRIVSIGSPAILPEVRSRIPSVP